MSDKKFRKQAFNLSLSIGWDLIQPCLFAVVTKVESFSSCVDLIYGLSTLSLETTSAGTAGNELKLLCKELSYKL